MPKFIVENPVTDKDYNRVPEKQRLSFSIYVKYVTDVVILHRVNEI